MESSVMRLMPRMVATLSMQLGTALFLSGCSTHWANLAVVSTKVVVPDPKSFELVDDHAEGESIDYVLFIIPTGTPDVEEAVSDALARSKADMLTDVVIDNETFILPPLFARF